MSQTISSSKVPFRGIASRKLKGGIFLLEGLNSLATTYAFYYLYFLAEKMYGFGPLQNFLLAAGLGGVYMVSAAMGGRFAQKHGYFFSFRLGVTVMMIGFAAASQVDALWPRLGCVVFANVGMCFTWPALQGLMSEGEPPKRLQGLVGMYNCTWAVAGAFGYFTGGAMLDAWGMRSIFLVPSAVMVFELLFVNWLQKRVEATPVPEQHYYGTVVKTPSQTYSAGVAPQTFLKMAWLANPFAYLAINTLISAIPTLANNLHITPKVAGFVCSIWMFVRAGAFVFLRFWPHWHYRFRFLATSYSAMVISFVLILLVPNLVVLLVAQVTFGLSMGLIYYSSLFYSMDVGETKGEHGGIHEAAIGAGCFGGPAIAAGALYFLPAYPHSGAWAVSALLLCGLGGLFGLRYRGK